jgi:hypothetical protein
LFEIEIAEAITLHADDKAAEGIALLGLRRPGWRERSAHQPESARRTNLHKATPRHQRFHGDSLEA